MTRLVLLFLLFAFSATAQMERRRAFLRPPPAAGGGGSGCDSLNNSTLKFYLPLDEPAGDRTDTKNSIVFTDINTVGVGTGKIGDAAAFVAANTETLSKTDSPEVSCVGDMTITLWVQPNSAIDVTSPVLFGKGLEYFCYRVGDGRLVGNVNDTSGFPNGSFFTTTATVPADSSTWSFVVFQYRTSVKKLRIKIGTGSTLGAWDEGNALPNAHEDSTADFVIGRNGPLGSQWYYGLMDEFSKWDAVLSDADIAALFAAGNACRPTGL